MISLNLPRSLRSQQPQFYSIPLLSFLEFLSPNVDAYQVKPKRVFISPRLPFSLSFFPFLSVSLTFTLALVSLWFFEPLLKVRAIFLKRQGVKLGGVNSHVLPCGQGMWFWREGRLRMINRDKAVLRKRQRTCPKCQFSICSRCPVARARTNWTGLLDCHHLFFWLSL